MTSEEEYESLADELRRTLIDAGAEPRDLTPLPGQAERAEEMLARILHTPKQGPAAPSEPGRPARRWTRWGALATAAAVIALVVVVVWPERSSSPAYAAPPLLVFPHEKAGATLPAGGEAGPALERLATLAARQPAPGQGPVQHVVLSAWWFTSGEAADGQTRTVLEPVERESFFQPDGSMRTIERRGPPLDDHGKLTTPGLLGAKLTDESFDFSKPGPGHVDRLPRDPERLGALLARKQDPSTCEVTGACLVSEVNSLHFSYVVPPGLTAALWRVLAADESITYLGRVRDRLDRPADAFTTAGLDGVSRQLLLIDPHTGLYLGEELVLTKPSDAFSLTPPAVLSFTALVRAERIDRDRMPPSP